MVATIKENIEELWWLFIFEGLAWIIFGIVALFQPNLTLAALIITVAAFSIIVGIVEVINGFASIGKTRSWWLSLILGLIFVGTGVFLIRHPGLTLGFAIGVLGGIMLIRGVFDLIAAAFFSSEDGRRWLMAISGVLGVIAAFYIWSNPAVGGLAFVWALGLYAIITGSIGISHAFYAKGLLDQLKKPVGTSRMHKA